MYNQSLFYLNSTYPMKFIGIDGCKAGWFYVGFDDKNQWQIGVIQHIDQIATFIPTSSLILIDIPIGLTGNTPKQRLCDIEARLRLKPKRSASVFPVPSRGSLQANNYQQASNLNFQASGRKLSKQSWNIMNKIKQVDDFILKTKERYKIREMHPELCFWALNQQQAMQHSKSTKQGFSEREKLLVVHCEATEKIVSEALRTFPRKDLARDDILDALVGAVTARFDENLVTLPKTPERDAMNLPMEVVFADMKVDRAVIKTPCGLLRLETQGNELLSVEWLLEECCEQPVQTQFLKNVVQQLQYYWSNPYMQFSIDKVKQGTAFMNRVWHALEQIPPGETRTYGDLAKSLNTSPRAVGNACRKNPYPLVVPCHRVVSVTELGGYDGQMGGEKLDIKKKLLAHEKILGSSLKNHRE